MRYTGASGCTRSLNSDLMKRTSATGRLLGPLLSVFAICMISACSDYYRNDYKDNSPTSGRLKVYYDEGLELPVKNQVATFSSQYPQVSLDLVQTSENEVIQALYDDSCEAIVTSRLLSPREAKAFESKQLFPKHTAVAKSGVAVITNRETRLDQISFEEVRALLSRPYFIKDSLGREVLVNVLFDKSNSAVFYYMKDSVLGDVPLSPNCNTVKSSLESIHYVATHKNVIAFVDFAWLSDTEDPAYKANAGRIRILPVSKAGSDTYEPPHQSSFKLGTYPFTRTVYVIRKTGEFTLAKGFESFIAGPKGQLTLLKQGLLPTRQPERAIEVRMETDKNQQ